MKRIGVANTLTLFRIVCIPFFLVFFWFHFYKTAMILYFLGSATDLIDGTVARLLKENTPLGAILDPIADKLCMLTVFGSLAFAEVVPWWFIIVMLSRDVVVTSGFIFVRVNQIPYRYHALISSKIATLCETVAGSFGIIYMAYPFATIGNYPVGDFVFGSVLIASVGILVATLQYLKVGMNLLEQKFES